MRTTSKRLSSTIAILVLTAIRSSMTGAQEAALETNAAASSAALPAYVQSFDAAWRIIRDSYFDPDFHGLDWEAVRTELRPKAEAARNVEELRGVIQQMLTKLGGSHMSLIPREVARSLASLRAKDRPKEGSEPDTQPTQSSNHAPGDESTGASVELSLAETSSPREGDLGFQFRVKDGRALITRIEPGGPADQGGVKPGWIIDAVDNDPISELLRPLPDTMNAPRGQFMAWGLVKGKLVGKPGSSVAIRFEDGSNEPLSLALERRCEQGQPTKLGYLPTLYAHLETERLASPTGGNVGLIRFNFWMIPIVQALDQAVNQFRHADGIIMDLRGNFGGLGGMILGVSGHFLRDRVSLGVLKMRGTELNFYSNPRLVNASGERVEPYSGPLAILTDGLSLSAAEIFAGGMQAIGRARVFGETSGGQALPAIWDRLPDGDVLYHAFGDFVTASGARLEGRGVKPDEIVPTTREDLLAGRDAPLLAALRWIGRQHQGPASEKKQPE